MTIVVITVAKMPYLHAVVVTPVAVDLPAAAGDPAVAGNTPVAVFFIVMCSNFVAEVLAAFWGSGVPAVTCYLVSEEVLVLLISLLLMASLLALLLLLA
jgi:hypothetical protein